jgi:hypothetical protein
VISLDGSHQLNTVSLFYAFALRAESRLPRV